MIITSFSFQNIIEQALAILVLFVCRAAKAMANLRICADSPEPLLLVYTKYVDAQTNILTSSTAGHGIEFFFFFFFGGGGGGFAHMR